jgi:hypothetical protein
MAVNRRALAVLLIVAVIVVFFMYPSSSRQSYYEPSGASLPSGPVQSDYNLNQGLSSANSEAVQGFNGPAFDVSGAGLIPREVTATEDFGQFSPDRILSGQNYLDPRSQIGYPETVGGVLRNANRDFRSEPINPRNPVSIWNLSTIPPDLMRPRFEISPEYK